jgi:copper chaperone CopZ
LAGIYYQQLNNRSIIEFEKGSSVMKKTFMLDGLECANCAAKMQEGIGKMDGVSSATVNFITAKLIIEGEADKMDGIVKAAGKLIRKLEPDVIMRGI